MRALSLHVEDLDRSDGSARFAFGDTVALASVTGPIEVRIAAEQASKATLEVTVRPLNGVPATEARALSTAIKSLLSSCIILSQNPRSLIQVVAQSLSTNADALSGVNQPLTPPALLAALTNACTLALLCSASIPMRGVVCAVAIGVAIGATGRQDGELIVDPADGGSGCFAVLFRGGAADGTPVWSSWHGSALSEKHLAEAWRLALVGTKDVLRAIRQAVGDDVHDSKMETD